MMSQDLVRVLEQVPEKRLALFALVWDLVGEDGEIDPGKAVFQGKELQLAIQEAQITREENHRLLEAIVRWCQDQSGLFL